MSQLKVLAVFSVVCLAVACSSAKEPDPESAIQTSAFSRTPEPGPEAEPESAWDGYVGCRTSVGECMNSCPTRSGLAKQEARCPEVTDPDSALFACYCRD